jgi:hypothetical protein
MTERFFFLHVQKAAGTSLLTRLQHQFGERAVYPASVDADPKGDSVISVHHLQERWRTRRDEIRVVTGHFPLCTVELLGGGFTTLTVLREPIERTLSYLRHRRQEAPEDRDKTLEEIYEDPYRFDSLIHNHMTKMFSLTAAEANAWQLEMAELLSRPADQSAPWILTKVEFTPERLERAKEGLASIDLIGLQDRFEQFCRSLTDRFGWDLGPALHQNRTEPGDVPAGLRDRIAEDNAMDIELYDFGRDLHERRSTPTSGFTTQP